MRDAMTARVRPPTINPHPAIDATALRAAPMSQRTAGTGSSPNYSIFRLRRESEQSSHRQQLTILYRRRTHPFIHNFFLCSYDSPRMNGLSRALIVRIFRPPTAACIAHTVLL